MRNSLGLLAQYRFRLSSLISLCCAYYALGKPAPISSCSLMSDKQIKPAPSILLQYRTWWVALFQALLIFTSLVLAWLLRFDFSLPYRVLLFSAAPLLIAVRLAAFGRFRLLHGWWRYTGVSDALDVLKATALGSAVFLFAMRFVLGVVAFPRTIYVLEGVLSMGLLAGVRLFSRILTESVYEVRQIPPKSNSDWSGWGRADGYSGDQAVEEQLRSSWLRRRRPI